MPPISKKFPYLLTICSFGSLFNPLVNAEQIANSSIDLKNEVEVIKQKNFRNKDNLNAPIEDSPTMKVKEEIRK